MRKVMFTLAALFVATALLSAADPPPKKPDPLQGTWTQVATEEHGKLKSELADPFTMVVQGDAVSLRHGERLIWAGTIRLSDTGTGPVKYDLTFDRPRGEFKPPGEGPGKGPAYGILEIRGDELRTASDRNELARPKNLTGSDGHIIFVWHRVP